MVLVFTTVVDHVKVKPESTRVRMRMRVSVRVRVRVRVCVRVRMRSVLACYAYHVTTCTSTTNIIPLVARTTLQYPIYSTTTPPPALLSLHSLFLY